MRISFFSWGVLSMCSYAASSFSASGYPKGTTVFSGSPYTRSVERISRSTCGPVAKTVSK